MKENPDYGTIHNKLLVLSIGTGSGKIEQKYNAKTAGKWGLVSWLFQNGSSPIISAFYEAGADLVDYQNNILFQSFRSEDKYLRVQVSRMIPFKFNFNVVIRLRLIGTYCWK